MSNPGRTRPRASGWFVRRRRNLLLLPAAAVVVATLVLGILVSRGAGGPDAARSPAATPDSMGYASEATSIFDREGPKDGVLLGRLNLAGVRDQEMRAAAFIDNQVEPRLVRMCEAGWLPSPAPGQECVDLVHTAGYKVTTTLDWQATERATGMLKDAITAGIQSGCDCHDGAVVTIEPGSGEVRVYVPNTNGDDRGDARARPEIDQLIEINAPGSAFMPVTFLAWFDRLGKAPMNTLWDTNPLQLPDGGAVVNPRADGGSEGLISARAALAGMQEAPAFRAADEVGVDAVLDVAAQLGITTLAQKFDPTWLNHPSVSYGPNIGAAGANITAMDLAYANATIANMGAMIGTPNLAATLDANDLQSISLASGQDYDDAVRQRALFQRGDLRLPDTRELDPIVVLEVLDRDGNVLFSQGRPERRQVIDPGSLWLLHTVMSDCRARYIIWPCGSSNTDLALDFSLPDGRRVQSGVQFGRMAFPPDPAKVLETWMTGYSRHAATLVWIGNSDNAPVNDRTFAASNAAVRFWKTWMGTYHGMLLARGVPSMDLAFEELQPSNVTFGPIRSTTTDRDHRPPGGTGYTGLCDQVVNGWSRTDVQYAGECESVEVDTRDSSRASSATPSEFRTALAFRTLPRLLPEAAVSLARSMGIPTAPRAPDD